MSDHDTFKPIGLVATGIVEGLRTKMIESGRMVAEPGLYRMPAKLYHTDPCIEPSLSNSVAKIIVGKSPRHAWIAHPRLNPAHKNSDPDRVMEIGSVAHALLLGEGAEIAPIDAKDYKKDDSKKARAAAYAANMLPILKPDLETAAAMVAVAKIELTYYPNIAPALALGGGQSEVVAVWRDGSAWCRCMIDRVSTDLRTILDYKTTGDAHPSACAARISQNDFQMQDPFYRRGLDALDPAGCGRRRFYFLYQEQDEPFACTVHELDGHHRHIGERQVETAVRAWSRCMSAGRERIHWPAYPRIIHRVEMKPWAEQQWLDREIADFDREQAAATQIAPLNILAAG